MPESLTRLQELALDFVIDDYREVQAIEEEVKLLFGNGVSRQQITTALEELREQQLVDAFLYRDVEKDFQRYRRPRPKAGARLWWRATAAGRRVHGNA